MATVERYSSFEEMNAATDKLAVTERTKKPRHKNTIAYLAALLRRNAVLSPKQSLQDRK